MKEIVLIGSGGFAREIAWLLEENNRYKEEWNLLGFISEEEPGSVIGNYKVLGNDDWLLKQKQDIHAACCIGDGAVRRRILSKLKKNPKIHYPNLIARQAEISDSVKLGEGCIITTGSVLTVDIKVGNFFISNLGSTIGHDCIIEDYVTLNPGSHISGNVRLESGVSIGTGAVVIQGVTVGENVTVGAGAAVIRELPPGCVAVGVPARPVIRR